MNRRAVRRLPGRVPGRATIDWQAMQITAKTNQNTPQKGNTMVNETIRRLTFEVDTLERKLAFLQKVDLSLLSDEIGDGDVTFIVNNEKVIKAHRFILGRMASNIQKSEIQASILQTHRHNLIERYFLINSWLATIDCQASKSSIFKRMFDTNMIEKYSGEIRVEDISASILRRFIEFLYTAELKFTDEATAAELFKVAHKYDIPELQAECEAELFKSVSEENLSEMLKLSHLYGMKRIKAKCVHILRDNFDRVQEKVLSDLLSPAVSKAA